MAHEGETVETVGETLTSGQTRIEASRRMIDDLDRRLHRASRLLATDDGDEAPEPR